MSLRIVEQLYKTKGMQHATVVVESDKREELERMDAKNAALEYARSKSFPAFGISNIPQIYPVDADGQISDEMLAGKKPVKSYRIDVDIVAGRAYP